MVSDATSSTAGAAIGIRQGLNQLQFGTKALSQAADQQASVALLLQGGTGASGGNVTETRGQNLNILV